jgi:hypothetical protein
VSLGNRLGLLALGVLSVALGLAFVLRRRSTAMFWCARIEKMSPRDQEITRGMFLKPRSVAWKVYLERVAVPLAGLPWLIIGGIMIGSGTGTF